MKKSALLAILGLTVSWSLPTALWGQSRQPAMPGPQSQEAAIVDASSQVLNEIMAVPATGIPKSLLANAQGIVIVPALVKAGFVIGVRHGRGVVVVRDERGQWKAPVFTTITGGSVGFQIGVQATDVVLVFKTQKSIQGLMNGKFTIGVDAAAAAGPVGREAAAATDTSLKAEIYSYSRSRGLFAGASLDGSAMQIDNNANAVYYQAPVGAVAGQPAQPQPLPPSAQRLLGEIARYTSKEAGPATPIGPAIATPPGNNAAADAQALKGQLAGSSQRLLALVDDQWKRYLALPAEVYAGDRQPGQEAMNLTLARYNSVAASPQYQTLAQRPEFQQTLGLLQQYSAALTAAQPLTLPAPPPMN